MSKNHLPFSPHPAMGQVAGISWCVCQTYPSTSHVALVTEDRVPARPCPTTDQFQWIPRASSRALLLQAHLCVMETNSSSQKLEVLPPGHTPAPLGQVLCFLSVEPPEKKHKITITTLIIIIINTLPCTVPAHGTTNTVTTN